MFFCNCYVIKHFTCIFMFTWPHFQNDPHACLKFIFFCRQSHSPVIITVSPCVISNKSYLKYLDPDGKPIWDHPQNVVNCSLAFFWLLLKIKSQPIVSIWVSWVLLLSHAKSVQLQMLLQMQSLCFIAIRRDMWVTVRWYVIVKNFWALRLMQEGCDWSASALRSSHIDPSISNWHRWW